MHARLEKRGIRQYAAMTKKTYAGVCEGFDYFSPTGSWQQQPAVPPLETLLYERLRLQTLVWQPETTVAVAV